MNSVVLFTDISPASTELFSELIEPTMKIETPYEAWEGIPYNAQKNIRMVGSDAYVHLETATCYILQPTPIYATNARGFMILDLPQKMTFYMQGIQSLPLMVLAQWI
jgi:hypothetical protein